MDRQPPDLSLAVGDGARRLTYAELADVRGISAASAERLARRRKWARQVGNDGVARVLVPLEEARKAKVRRDAGQSPDIRTVTPDILPAIREVIREVVEPLTAQLERERSRVDRAERLLEEERERSGKLQSSLADAVGAERIATGEAAALRAELDALRKRRRRWFRWK
jgi:hypothetical protein